MKRPRLEKKSRKAIIALVAAGPKADKNAIAKGCGFDRKNLKRSIYRWQKRGIIELVPGGYYRIRAPWKQFIHGQQQKGAEEYEVHDWWYELTYKTPGQGSKIEHVQLVIDKFGVDAQMNLKENVALARVRGISVRLTSLGKCIIQLKDMQEYGSGDRKQFMRAIEKGEKIVRSLIPEIEKRFHIYVSGEKEGELKIVLKRCHFAKNRSAWARLAQLLNRRFEITLENGKKLSTDNSPDEDGVSKQQLETDSPKMGEEVYDVEDIWQDAQKGHSMRKNSEGIEEMKALLKMQMRAFDKRMEAQEGMVKENLELQMNTQKQINMMLGMQGGESREGKSLAPKKPEKPYYVG